MRERMESSSRCFHSRTEIRHTGESRQEIDPKRWNSKLNVDIRTSEVGEPPPDALASSAKWPAFQQSMKLVDARALVDGVAAPALGKLLQPRGGVRQRKMVLVGHAGRL